MPQPPAYNRTKDFTENFGSETDHSSLNAELDAASNSINDIRDNLALIQADDGKILQAAITTDSLSTQVKDFLINEVSNGIVEYRDAAANSAAAADASADAAALSQTAAATSATNAGNSATAAATSASNASTSASNAATSATTASTAATTATTKAGEAATSAANAATSASTATTKAGEAATSATTATTKAGEATTSAANAAGSATAAATSATNAGNSATAAATSENNAATSAAQAAASAMPAVHMVKGLTGNVNAATPLTKYDLNALAVVLRNAAGNTVTRYNTGTLTCDLGLAGSAANGRDQAAAFTANSWIYLYFIWNGTTLATLASTTQPASFTGATLPSGYTHWAFATALRWNASSNIIPVIVRGAEATYDLVDGSTNRVVAAAANTTANTVSCAGFIPPIARVGVFNFFLSYVHGATQNFNLFIRPTGSSHNGAAVVRQTTQVAGIEVIGSNWTRFPVSAAQQIDYRMSSAPSTSGGAYIDVMGYIVPNGDV